MRKLSEDQVTQVLDKARRGISPTDIAREYGITRQAVTYQLSKNHFIHVQYSGPAPGQTLRYSGTFWLYYNTNRGRPRDDRQEPAAPWILRVLAPRTPGIQSEDEKILPDGREIRVREVRLIQGNGSTRYYPNPVWKNRLGDHIKYVRGLVELHGVVEVKT